LTSLLTFLCFVLLFYCPFFLCLFALPLFPSSRRSPLYTRLFPLSDPFPFLFVARWNFTFLLRVVISLSAPTFFSLRICVESGFPRVRSVLFCSHPRLCESINRPGFHGSRSGEYAPFTFTLASLAPIFCRARLYHCCLYRYLQVVVKSFHALVMVTFFPSLFQSGRRDRDFVPDADEYFLRSPFQPPFDNRGLRSFPCYAFLAIHDLFLGSLIVLFSSPEVIFCPGLGANYLFFPWLFPFFFEQFCPSSFLHGGHNRFCLLSSMLEVWSSGSVQVVFLLSNENDL